MKYICLLAFMIITTGIFAQDKDASHYFEYHPEGTTIKVFETEIFHGNKTVKIKGKEYHYTTDETNDWGIDTNYYWDDDEYFYKYYPGLHVSDNFLPKKVHLGQEWIGKTGKHKYRIEKTLNELEISGLNNEKSTYQDVIHVTMSPVNEGLYKPYHRFYAKGFGLIKLLHETNSYELK